MATSEHHDLRREALDVARSLTAGDEALVAVLRDLERDRGTTAQTAGAVVRALAATLHARDGYAAGRADAVHDLSIAVGSRLGLGERELVELAAVAMLHDVGKISIPEEIVRKKGRLNAAEWNMMREHPLVGERIVSSVQGLEDVARAVRHEHERWDGGGYPDGIAGEEIPIASRIVHACSTWHALISARPHRAPLPVEQAIAELRAGAGTQFDRRVVETLLAVVVESDAGPAVEPPSRRSTIVHGDGGSKLEQELIALIAVASAVAAANRLEEVVDIAAEHACEAIGASSLSIDRYHPDQDLLQTVVNVGDLAEGEERHPADEIYRLDEGRVMRTVLEQGGVHWCSLDDASIGEFERGLLQSFGKHSSVAVPIIRGGETWGQIWASRRADQPPFGERDARFLHAIAGQVGAAIGRAELFAQLSELASTDGLTGLANRRAFDEALEPAVLDARAAKTDLALVLCDLDDLKEINDHQGHEAGDAALKTVAAALTSVAATCEEALVYRIGGDEFCLLVSGCDPERARSLAGAAVRRAAAADPPAGVSCGVAVLEAGRGRPADLLRAADAAQYAAKRS
ncbi:MAG: diguanylate cyclase, partial [Solirubrobacteraceae bacterium]|nr:diguanylate cyclase [Solirubrobacteraceae bacterium]